MFKYSKDFQHILIWFASCYHCSKNCWNLYCTNISNLNIIHFDDQVKLPLVRIPHSLEDLIKWGEFLSCAYTNLCYIHTLIFSWRWDIYLNKNIHECLVMKKSSLNLYIWEIIHRINTHLIFISGPSSDFDILFDPEMGDEGAYTTAILPDPSNSSLSIAFWVKFNQNQKDSEDAVLVKLGYLTCVIMDIL